MISADCHYGDHWWNGTSQCACGARLRCGLCGVYVREDNLEAHFERCRVLTKARQR